MATVREPETFWSVADGLRIIGAEYTEIPGLHLTAKRLWNLDPMTCDALLNALVDGTFLRRVENGGYVRADSCRWRCSP